jgi:plastocyanin
MPPWSTAEGGPLNDFQIQQLVILITSEHFYEHGWEFAVEEGNHSDAFVPHKDLEEAVGEGDTTIVLNDASGLLEDSFLRIGGDTIEEPYEVLLVTSFDEDTGEVEVERAQMGSDALEHEAGSEVYNGPIPPPEADAPRTGEVGTPPCGQAAPAPSNGGGDAAEVALADVDEIDMQDNVFVIAGEENPTLTMAAGESFTIPLVNTGTAIHNAATAGPDGELGTSDDIVSDPSTIPGGSEGEITITYDEAGTYEYHCEFHPDTMVGEIVVE